ncbi:class I SAM-dependent methyltransferase [Curvivirga sp.]|uniref:class I SAM-dependent methyltransferase n=1 Tax=Curvivirga sp. TaxID=2856848 RepID=UPI003B5A3F1C
MDGLKFRFGKNWKNFSRILGAERIEASKVNIKRLLKMDSLKDQTFLDIGSGSGLSSVAANALGASVRAFDYDLDSVEASKTNLDRFCKDGHWEITQGSALDAEFMSSLGKFDIVYSWGVLHHTGDMWTGIDLASKTVKPDGVFALAIYNDQGGASRRWLKVKKTYVRSPKIVQFLIALMFFFYFELRGFLIRLVRFQNPLPFSDWQKRKESRGMSVWYDVIDWVGGYPFEVAKPEEILSFLMERGFRLESMYTCAGGHGCNEFLFRKETTE